MLSTPLVLPLRGTVIFPGTLRAVPVLRPIVAATVRQHLEQGLPLVLLTQLEADHEDPVSARYARVGVLARVLRSTELPDGTMRLLVEGGERVRVRSGVTIVEGGLHADVSMIPVVTSDPKRLTTLAAEVADLFDTWLAGQGLHPHEADVLEAPSDAPDRLADQIAGQLDLETPAHLELLETADLDRRMALILDHLAVARGRQQLKADIEAKVQGAMDQKNRDYQLREQLNQLREELGDRAGPDADADAFAERLRGLGMPDEQLEEALREVDRLRRVHVDAAEFTIIRTWLETLCDLPWSTYTVDRTDLRAARDVLDGDHYGLEPIKERILDYLAVRQLNPDSRGNILCFVGPPGVGKTSLGRSIAEAVGRKFARIALGGVKDETEIRGHRRTYIGALPGRIVRALTRAGSANPVLLLDELDKVGTDPHRGDPASALLEVLDAEQNSAFVDHYVDLPIDLSQVLFIATANLEAPIPPALHDRLEIIELRGYTEEEKVAISTQHLLPRLAKNHGLNDSELKISRAALQHIIRDYTREAGVRDLERSLAKLHRKVARKIVEGKLKRTSIGPSDIKAYLGPPKFFLDALETEAQVGVVVGLAWTSAGGDILFIEAAKMPGKHALKLTGSLGDVMKESAEAAMTWLRSHASELGIADDAFEAQFHLHVPAGAIPKDGPSAGVTMVTALASLLTGRRVRHRLAMTGEITLRGRVLAIGGTKEKVLAARRAGVDTILLPARNESDLEDIPAGLRRDLTFHFVENVIDVLDLALEPADAQG